MRTSRGARLAATTLYPRSYMVFRNLSLRVREGEVSVAQVPFSDLRTLLPSVVERTRQNAATNRAWNAFATVSEDVLELGIPTRVVACVEPHSWWCSRGCGKFYSGQLQRLGIRRGICPACEVKGIVQLASVFMCPRCHSIRAVEPPRCRECGDSQHVVLQGTGGRRREYAWVCSRHPAFREAVEGYCDRGHQAVRMAMKSTGGLLYKPERITDITYREFRGQEGISARGLVAYRAKVRVVEAVVGRTPIADSRQFYTGRELSPIEPFLNPATGHFMGFVSQLKTDAIVIDVANEAARSHLGLHSLKHALLNAAPGVTGLTQDEFGAYLPDDGRLVVYDNVAGGTGGCRLLADRRLDRWLTLARELAECHQNQCDSACRGCLFLPARVCGENNQQLDRYEVLRLIQ